jgi:cytoskeletal protein RodZ
MESLGDKLKTARTEKGLNFEQISRETNISLSYLQALEAENFGIFPGEPYVIGFLKNYGAYLELDVQKLISLYRALRIQEQPIPVEQLLRHNTKPPTFLLPLFIILIAAGAGGYGIYYLITHRQQILTENLLVVRKPTEYVMDGHFIDKRFYKNDSLLVPIGTEIYKLELFNIGEVVTINTPVGTVVLDLSQDASVDLNNDGIHDLRITVADFAKNKADAGAQLYFYLTDTFALYDAAARAEQDTTYIPNAISSISTTLIPASSSAYPFTLQIIFQGYCMFRWEILNERDRRDKNQRYFQHAEELNIQAQNGIRIWMSNAQAAKFQIIGGGRSVPVEIGAAGEVVVSDFRWVRDEDGRYRLVLIRLETGS